jgi:hypothetical protein
MAAIHTQSFQFDLMWRAYQSSICKGIVYKEELSYNESTIFLDIVEKLHAWAKKLGVVYDNSLFTDEDVLSKNANVALSLLNSYYFRQNAPFKPEEEPMTLLTHVLTLYYNHILSSKTRKLVLFKYITKIRSALKGLRPNSQLKRPPKLISLTGQGMIMTAFLLELEQHVQDSPKTRSNCLQYFMTSEIWSMEALEANCILFPKYGSSLSLRAFKYSGPLRIKFRVNGEVYDKLKLKNSNPKNGVYGLNELTTFLKVLSYKNDDEFAYFCEYEWSESERMEGINNLLLVSFAFFFLISSIYTCYFVQKIRKFKRELKKDESKDEQDEDIDDELYYSLGN